MAKKREKVYEKRLFRTWWRGKGVLEGSFCGEKGRRALSGENERKEKRDCRKGGTTQKHSNFFLIPKHCFSRTKRPTYAHSAKFGHNFFFWLSAQYRHNLHAPHFLSLFLCSFIPHVLLRMVLLQRKSIPHTVSPPRFTPTVQYIRIRYVQ